MLDILSLILIITGGAVTYGSKYLVRLLKLGETDGKIIIIKLTGLIIAALGCLRVMDII